MKKALLILACLFSLSLAGQSSFKHAGSWNEIFSKARAEHKMVLVDCYFKGCHPCKQMEDEVFPHPDVRRIMETAFIGFKIDCLKEPLGRDLQIKFGITGFPTYLIFNSDGQLIDYFSGYKEADKFTALLKNAVQSSRAGKQLSGFSAAINGDYPSFYRAYFTERKPFSTEALDRFFLAQSDPVKESAVLPLLMSGNLSDTLSRFVLEHYNTLVSRFGKGLVDKQRMRIVQREIAKTPAAADKQWFQGFLVRMKSFSNESDWPYFQLDLAEAYYYNHLKKPASFFKFAAAHPNDDDNKVRYMGMRLAGPKATGNEKDLYVRWADKVLNKNSTQDALVFAASILLQQDRKNDAARLARWALQKARLNNRNTAGPQSILDKINME